MTQVTSSGESRRVIETGAVLESSELAMAHATLQAKHKDTLLLLARLHNSKIMLPKIKEGTPSARAIASSSN